MQTVQEVLRSLNAHTLDRITPSLSDKSFANQSVDHLNVNAPTMENMYSSSDLAIFPMFFGGYINFGFWKGIDLEVENISVDDRIRSSENLYNYVFEKLSLQNQSEVLEVGSGQGYGCVMLNNKFKVHKIIGLDSTREQVERSIAKHSEILKSSSRMRFIVGKAEEIPLPNNSFTQVFSVEAAQHFVSINDFLSETYRVLKPNGVLVLTTFFAKNKGSVDKLKLVVPDFNVHMSHFTIEDVKFALIYKGFQNIIIENIGSFVWAGIDKWLNQVVPKMWSRIWLKAYQAGLVDYYVIQANSPGHI